MKRALLCVLVAGLLSGCGIYHHSQALATRALINSKLEVGMTRQQVIDVIGNPYQREAYDTTDVLFYKTEHLRSNLMDRATFTTPIVLKDGIVTGWGTKYFQDPNTFKADITIKRR